MTDKYDSQSQVADNLPRDATGKVIPFDTERLYSRKSESNTLTVRSIKYDRVRKSWLFEFRDGWYMPCNGYFLDPPDSWERLLKDLDRANSGKYGPSACLYAGSEDEKCVGCRFDGGINGSPSCSYAMLADVARRIRELREADADAD